MTRVISGVALAAAALAAILLLPLAALRIVACAVAALAAHEYVRVAGAARGVSQWVILALVVAACWVVSSGRVPEAMPLVIGALVWVGVEVLFLGRTIHQAAVGLFAPIYIGAPMGMLVAIHERGGWQATLLVIATIVVSDSGQYYSGRRFGRRPLAPSISPKKTVEGAIGGVVLGTAFMVVAGRLVFPEGTVVEWLITAIAIVLLGICGDLFESRLKRSAGMKDSSTLIPGHGGVLDRIDALLFAIPVFYLHLPALV